MWGSVCGGVCVRLGCRARWGASLREEGASRSKNVLPFPRIQIAEYFHGKFPGKVPLGSPEPVGKKKFKVIIIKNKIMIIINIRNIIINNDERLNDGQEEYFPGRARAKPPPTGLGGPWVAEGERPGEGERRALASLGEGRCLPGPSETLPRLFLIRSVNQAGPEGRGRE